MMIRLPLSWINGRHIFDASQQILIHCHTEHASFLRKMMCLNKADKSILLVHVLINEIYAACIHVCIQHI